MRVLVACEFSGVVREAFRKRGHDAWSCDLLPALDKSAAHITGDVLAILDRGWEMMIAHPPCTWLCRAQHTNARRKDRPHVTAKFESERQKAFEFAMTLFAAPIDRIALENPLGYLNEHWRKYDQLLRPFNFGHPYHKATCLWLKNLPPLISSMIETARTKKLDLWSNKRNPDGYSIKSITFQGIAEAMAEQWGS
jgi:hypothetical protein